jgi:hypothetical protein
MPSLNVLSICGSLRKGSYNAIVQRALPSLAPEGMTIKPAPSFAEFPLYNADIQNSTGFPAAVNTLADAIRAADGVIFCTPEYNFTIPGGLKNAIDWVSRLQNQPFAGKPVARAIRHAQGDDVSRCPHAQQAGNLRRQLRIQTRRGHGRDQGRDDTRLHQAAACGLRDLHRASVAEDLRTISTLVRKGAQT